ncbi:MAG: redoxin domain-containing protein [Myxococcota bacterium]
MCPAEVSDVEVSIWETYREEGLVVWAIAAYDDAETVSAFKEQMGLTFPVLLDPGGAVHGQYSQSTAFLNTVYPQDWVIGTDGTVIYFSNAYDVEALKAVIETEL